MKVGLRKSIFATIAVASFTVSMAFAGFPGRGHWSRKSATIDILGTTRVPDGPTLKPGTYKVTLLDRPSKPEVDFYRQGKLVGRAPVKLVDEGKKIDQTEIEADKQHDGTYVLAEIDLRGLTQKATLGATGAGSQAAE